MERLYRMNSFGIDAVLGEKKISSLRIDNLLPDACGVEGAAL